MSRRKKVDRLYVDRKDLDDWKRLKEKDSPFSGCDNKDVFMAAMVVGYHERSKIELKSREGYFFSDNLNPEELAIVRAVAVSEEGTLNVLLDEQRVFSIAEQYATGGVKLLKNRIFSGEYGSYAKKLESDLLRQYDKTLKEVSREPQLPDEIDDVSIMDLVAGGETDKVEFKSSLIWDYRKKQASKEVKVAVARAVSSFMNSNGGYLLVGVDDEKNLLGLAKDLALCHKSTDEFERTLTNTLNDCLGKVNRPLVNMRFKKTEDKIVAVIRIRTSPHPVYLESENRRKEFYIRSGNSSQMLDVSEAAQYIKEHWPDF